MVAGASGKKSLESRRDQAGGTLAEEFTAWDVEKIFVDNPSGTET